MYWESVWKKSDIDEFRNYIQAYKGIENCMTRFFKENACENICDAACGFGANSMILLSNGFNVYGFDISENSIWLTCQLLKDEGLKSEQYMVASLLETKYTDGFFDAVAVRAALDHLSVVDLNNALIELRRIIKTHGLLYASFDPMEKEDEDAEHEILADGSYKYISGDRDGLLFHYYSDEEIRKVFSEFEILHFEIDQRGNRHIIVRMK